MPLQLPAHADTLADGVASAVRDAIASGDLDPAETYSVYRLADQLGVSRSPVREALLRLAEAGLVEISRNRGFRVVRPTAHDVAEIFEIRLALEPPAAARVAGDPDRVAATLGGHLATMTRAASYGRVGGPGGRADATTTERSPGGRADASTTERSPGGRADASTTERSPGGRAGERQRAESRPRATGRPDGPGSEAEFWAADRALHRAILEAAGNRRAAAVVEQLRATTALLGPPTTSTGRSLADIAAEHAPVVTAILAGDAEAAAAAMSGHLRRTERLLVTGLSR